MKNQYFGDINDYRKYGLLRIITGMGQRKAAVCWMLTPDDSRSDGGKKGYLRRPDLWRQFDTPLFDTLHLCVQVHERRDVHVPEEQQVIPNAFYYDAVLPDDMSGRTTYFNRFLEGISDCELLFFDPDIGLEVKSTSKGNKNSAKYLYWDDLAESYRRGKSVLVYQHFPRKTRPAFIEELVGQIRVKTGADVIFSFATANVLFLLMPTPAMIEYYERASEQVDKVWEGQMQVRKHSPICSKSPLDEAANQREIPIGYPMFCPVCGLKVHFDDPKFAYCDHIKFVYGWNSGDDDAFIHSQPSFARDYIAQLFLSGTFEQYLEKNELQIGDTHLSRFVKGAFEPCDQTAKMIPYIPECIPKFISIFACHWSTNSGAFIGIACGEIAAR